MTAAFARARAGAVAARAARRARVDGSRGAARAGAVVGAAARRLPAAAGREAQRHQDHGRRAHRARRYRARGGTATVIMPAPTVSFVASSMRMNEPVARLRA